MGCVTMFWNAQSVAQSVDLSLLMILQDKPKPSSGGPIAGMTIADEATIEGRNIDMENISENFDLVCPKCFESFKADNISINASTGEDNSGIYIWIECPYCTYETSIITSKGNPNDLFLP